MLRITAFGNDVELLAVSGFFPNVNTSLALFLTSTLRNPLTSLMSALTDRCNSCVLLPPSSSFRAVALFQEKRSGSNYQDLHQNLLRVRLLFPIPFQHGCFTLTSSSFCAVVLLLQETDASPTLQGLSHGLAPLLEGVLTLALYLRPPRRANPRDTTYSFTHRLSASFIAQCPNIYMLTPQDHDGSPWISNFDQESNEQMTDVLILHVSPTPTSLALQIVPSSRSSCHRFSPPASSESKIARGSESTMPSRVWYSTLLVRSHGLALLQVCWGSTTTDRLMSPPWVGTSLQTTLRSFALLSKMNGRGVYDL